MKLCIASDVLLAALDQVAGAAVRGESTLPVVASVLLVVDPALGTGRVSCTDLGVELTATFSVDPDSEAGAVLLRVDRLQKILKKLLKGQVVTIERPEPAEAGHLTLTTGRSRYKLFSLHPDDYPAPRPDEKWIATTKIPAGRLRALLDRVAYAQADQDIRYQLVGTMLAVTLAGVTAAATDGHRLVMARARDDSGQQWQGGGSGIIPRRAAGLLAKLCEEGSEAPVTVRISEPHIAVDLGGVQFRTATISGAFPNTSAITDKFKPVASYQVKRTDLLQALDRLRALALKTGAVRMEVEGGVLSVVHTNAEAEEGVEEVPIDAVLAPPPIAFNLEFLRQAVLAVAGTELAIVLEDTDKVAELGGDMEGDDVVEGGGVSARHFLMPVRT